MAKLCPNCGERLSCGCQKININGKICCPKCKSKCGSTSTNKGPIKVQYIGPGN